MHNTFRKITKCGTQLEIVAKACVPLWLPKSPVHALFMCSEETADSLDLQVQIDPKINAHLDW